MADYLLKKEVVNFGEGSWAVSLYLRVEQIAQSFEDNQTTLRLGMYVSTPAGCVINWTDYAGSYLGLGAYNGGDEQKTTFSKSVNGSGTQWLQTGVVVVVNHSSMGLANAAPIIWKWGVNSEWGQFVIPTGEKQIALPKIPIPTTPVISSQHAVIGSTITISLPRTSNDYTHVLDYTFANESAGIGYGYTTSASWEIPSYLVNKIKGARSGPCTITCKTYNGQTLVGTRSVLLTLYIPSDSEPLIHSVSIDEATPGIAAQFGAFIVGKSKLAIHIAAEGADGSEITKYWATIDGELYTGATFETKVIKNFGALDLKVTVMDSRGQTTSAIFDVTVLSYTPPKISDFSAWRINTSGAKTEAGTRIAVSMKYDLTSLSAHNAHTYQLQYRRAGASNFTTFASGSASWAYNSTRSFTTSPAILPEYAYEVKLVLTDFFGSAEAVTEIPVGFSLLDFRSTGKGVAFGKISEQDAMEIDMPIIINGETLEDHVLAEGTSGIWTYRKWNSGIAECWGDYSATGVNIAKNNYSGFYYSDPMTVSLPFTFSAAPSFVTDGGATSMICFSRRIESTTAAVKFWICCLMNTSPATSADINVSLHVRGRWR